MKEQLKIESQKILNHFGRDAQIIKMGEECSELSAAIFQSLCSTKDKIENEEKIYGELADVYNLMQQMMCVFDAGTIEMIARNKRRNCIQKYIDNPLT